MGKFTTTIFAEKIIQMIESKMDFSFYIPNRFKASWFENVDFAREYKENDCILDSDGFWKSKNMDGTNGKGDHTQYNKFWWRIEPNYISAGRPSYSSEQIADFYKKSETKKSILKLTKSEVCLEWDGFNMPTETYWGLRMRYIYITIYENGEKIYSGLPINSRAKGWKKHLITFIEEYYKFTK